MGLGKLGNFAARAASPIAQRIGTQVLNSTTRSALASGTTGMVQNTGDYAVNSEEPRSIGGFAAAAGTGFGFGAGFSAGSAKLGGYFIKNLEITGANATATVSAAVDHTLGGVGAMANEWFRPAGKQTRESMMQQFGTGFLSGAEGPTFSARRAG